MSPLFTNLSAHVQILTRKVLHSVYDYGRIKFSLDGRVVRALVSGAETRVRFRAGSTLKLVFTLKLV